MSSKEPKSHLISRLPSGEVMLPLSKRLLPRPDGSTQQTISVNLHEAGVPERKYVADVAAIEETGMGVRLLFGQLSLGKGLRSIVLINLYAESVRTLVEGCGQFLPQLRAFAERNKLPPVSLQRFQQEPPQTVSLAATMVACAQSGRAAAMDFYHISPVLMHRAVQQNASALAVDPVVHVDLPTALLLAVLEALQNILPHLPPDPV